MGPEQKVIAAAQQGNIEFLKTAIAEGANVNEQDTQGWTALHWAAGKDEVEVIKVLLEHEADAKLAGRDNRTPLMVARAAGRHAAISVLTAAEKSRGVWRDPAASRVYCKGYYLKDVSRSPQWPSAYTDQENGSEQPTGGESIVYLHQDFTVTKSVWHDENIIFNAITPEWIHFCETELNFAIPAELL
jgi:ankyrin repeat protein